MEMLGLSLNYTETKITVRDTYDDTKYHNAITTDFVYLIPFLILM